MVNIFNKDVSLYAMRINNLPSLGLKHKLTTARCNSSYIISCAYYDKVTFYFRFLLQHGIVSDEVILNLGSISVCNVKNYIKNIDLKRNENKYLDSSLLTYTYSLISVLFSFRLVKNVDNIASASSYSEEPTKVNSVYNLYPECSEYTVSEDCIDYIYYLNTNKYLNDVISMANDMQFDVENTDQVAHLNEKYAYQHEYDDIANYKWLQFHTLSDDVSLNVYNNTRLFHYVWAYAFTHNQLSICKKCEEIFKENQTRIISSTIYKHTNKTFYSYIEELTTDNDVKDYLVLARLVCSSDIKKYWNSLNDYYKKIYTDYFITTDYYDINEWQSILKTIASTTLSSVPTSDNAYITNIRPVLMSDITLLNSSEFNEHEVFSNDEVYIESKSHQISDMVLFGKGITL